MKEALIIFMVLLLLMLIISVFGGSIRYTNNAVSSQLRFPRYEPFYADDDQGIKKKYPIAPVPPAATSIPKEPPAVATSTGVPATKGAEHETFTNKEDVKGALDNIVNKIKNVSTFQNAPAIEPFESSGEFAAF